VGRYVNTFGGGPVAPAPHRLFVPAVTHVAAAPALFMPVVAGGNGRPAGVAGAQVVAPPAPCSVTLGQQADDMSEVDLS
jgi:hypothetical protein